MAKKDLYEDLLKGFEFMLGRLPNREQFKSALQATISEEEIRVVLLLPMQGLIEMEEFERRASRIGISKAELHGILKRLVPEGFILSYLAPEGEVENAIVYPTPSPLRKLDHQQRIVQRGDIVIFCELQVRKKENDPMRQAATQWMNSMSEDAGRSIPTKTPYFRVIPYESAVKEQPEYGRININASVPDNTRVLPFDVVSEMVRKETMIALADCYCRSTKRNLGEGCDHPLEVCLYFNRLAVIQIETGRARQITADEAIEVLRISEEAGLIHNISNVGDGISTICNCCIHACGAVKSLAIGGRNAAEVSRFVVHWDSNKCIGCGICVESCPIDALTMQGEHIIISERCVGCGLCVNRCPKLCLHLDFREDQPKVFHSPERLSKRIAREALFGFIKKKLIRLFRWVKSK